MTNDNTDNTDEPSKAELHDRVQQLESTVEKLMPSRRDALRMGAAGIAGAAGLSATTQPADASTGSSGQIGDPSNRPTIFADDIDANEVKGLLSTRTRVFLSSAPSASSDPIPLDSVSFDPDNNFDTSTHEYTVPATGAYLSLFQIRLSNNISNGTNCVFSLDQNGNNISDVEIISQGDFQTVTGTDIREFSSGDKITVANRQPVQISNGSNSTFLTIIRVE